MSLPSSPLQRVRGLYSRGQSLLRGNAIDFALSGWFWHASLRLSQVMQLESWHIALSRLKGNTVSVSQRLSLDQSVSGAGRLEEG